MEERRAGFIESVVRVVGALGYLAFLGVAAFKSMEWLHTHERKEKAVVVPRAYDGVEDAPRAVPVEEPLKAQPVDEPLRAEPVDEEELNRPLRAIPLTPRERLQIEREEGNNYGFER